jgi:hypothetical protein
MWAQVAQLVEHCTENAGVGGSIPPLGTNTKIRVLILLGFFLKKSYRRNRNRTLSASVGKQMVHRAIQCPLTGGKADTAPTARDVAF